MGLTPVKKKGAAAVFEKLAKEKQEHDSVMDEIFGDGTAAYSNVAETKEDAPYSGSNQQIATRSGHVAAAIDYIDAKPTLPLKAKVDFKDVLDGLKTLDDKYKVLWKQIYDHAMADRNNAYVIWYDLYQIVVGSEENHFKHGATLAKYMERFEKANGQLLKLAELLDKVREKEEEENAGPSGADLYAEWEKQK